jgi:hypothetical protein
MYSDSLNGPAKEPWDLVSCDQILYQESRGLTYQGIYTQVHIHPNPI